MNDAEYERQRARVMTLVHKWQMQLGLGSWKIRYEWERGSISLPSGLKTSERFAPIMICEPHWPYLMADVLVSLQEVKDATDEDLEHYLVHEYAHCLLNEMHDWNEEEGRFHEERVATMLEKAFVWVWQAGWESAKEPTYPDYEG